MFHLSFMLYDSYKSYIISRPKKHNKYKWFKSRLILITGEKNSHIVLWEKEKHFVNKMNMHLKMICKIQRDFQFPEAKGCFVFIVESTAFNTPG